MADVEPPEFRQLLGRFATGVTVVTTRDAEGKPVGMTASSLSSVSLIPPLLSVCVDRAANLHAPIVAAEHFAVNILAEQQEALSRRFAGPHEGRFDGVGYRLSENGLVLLDGVVAHIECERDRVYETGDHAMIIGRVVGGATRDARPLLYYRGGYAALG
jgi:flavin reductase (DIM6/NTAB) family NADH-FMN oxidoreductase RutF